MKRRLFLIPSLLAAGMLPGKASALPEMPPQISKGDSPPLFERLRLKHLFTLAGHRSHSSHSSHASHRSSSGSSYLSRPQRTAPLYTPPLLKAPASPAPAEPAPSQRNLNSTPPSSVLPSPPAALPKTLPGNSEKFKRIVMDVQVAMIVYGYYDGLIDGVIGPSAKVALSKLQKDYGLKVTGTVTPEVLDALGIPAQ